MLSKGVDSLDRTEDNPVHCMPGLTAGLSGRLLLLTVIFVMIAEVLIFVPSVANMRLSWLRDRLNTAAAAGAVIDGLQAELPRSVQNDTLMATGGKAYCAAQGRHVAPARGGGNAARSGRAI